MRVVLTGASGQLGAYVLVRLAAGRHEVVAWSGTVTGGQGGVEWRQVDLTVVAATERALAEADPEVIVHLAAVSTAEGVRREPEHGRAVNVAATEKLAAWCGRFDRRLVYSSTDLVFDGSRPWNREDDPAEPILAYGRTKRDAEPAVLALPRGLVARISLLYGPSRSSRTGFFDRTLAALREGRPQTLFEDEWRTPLDYATAAEILARLVTSDVAGLLHIGGHERLTRFELIRRAGVVLGIDPGLVLANRRGDVPAPEPRPADVSLDTSRLAALFPDLKRPSIEEALGGAPV